MESTASSCARILLNALESGNRPQIDCALHRAELLRTASVADTREDEFRDLLGAVIESVSGSGRTTAGSAQRAVAVQMLSHLARSAA